MKRINKFIILSLKMEGFKRFKEPYTMEFDRLTYISGANGQGKSTIADAIAYAFCGTPFWGEKSLDKLQNPDCKEMSVELQFVDEDGELHTLSRRRCGNTTTVTMDTVQLRQTDLNNILAEKDIFLSLLNPLYFIENIADNGREFLQKLLPPVDNTKVLEALSESTRAILDKQNLTEPCYFIKKQREEIRELDENDVYFEGQIDLLKSQRQEAEKNLDAVIERGKKIVSRKEELEEKQYKGIDVEALKKAQSKIAETLSDDRRSKLIAKRAEIQSRAYVSKYSQQIASVMGTEIEEYQRRIEKLIRNGNSSQAILDRWELKIRALESKKREYETILKQNLSGMDENFMILRNMCDQFKYNVRASSLAGLAA